MDTRNAEPLARAGALIRENDWGRGVTSLMILQLLNRGDLSMSPSKRAT